MQPNQRTAHCVLYHPKHPKSSSVGHFLALLLLLLDYSIITFTCAAPPKSTCFIQPFNGVVDRDFYPNDRPISRVYSCMLN